MYAIIEDSGTQIKVEHGSVIKVALRELPQDSATLTFDRVLMVGDPQDESKTQIGTPLVDGAKVIGDLIAQEKTPRVPVVKFKRRKNYLRHKGHRQDYLKVKVTSIEV